MVLKLVIVSPMFKVNCKLPDNDKVLTLCKTICYILGGQGYSSCICKGKSQSKHCTSFKALVKCKSDHN